MRFESNWVVRFHVARRIQGARTKPIELNQDSKLGVEIVPGNVGR